ncbi:hypothetical protein D1B33_12315 [Lysinibacillus yapensis]|uniref:Uncharacterized protein n=1 Tax=Ureibacillus yapensis TaxID=2304605 RepID=A0A396SCF5_9BACL|nr:hypothetical protein [Lysinibacillus yapensis]RHW35876.1 hypothetical protein D1B33_12315 [Lysinibacillus yapensis]
MAIPFDKYTIYITLDDDKIYELKEDFSKELVNEIKVSTPKKPTLLLHKQQLDYAKTHYMENSIKLDKETWTNYYKMGFITLMELDEFTSK